MIKIIAFLASSMSYRMSAHMSYDTLRTAYFRFKVGILSQKTHIFQLCPVVTHMSSNMSRRSCQICGLKRYTKYFDQDSRKCLDCSGFCTTCNHLSWNCNCSTLSSIQSTTQLRCEIIQSYQEKATSQREKYFGEEFARYRVRCLQYIVIPFFTPEECDELLEISREISTWQTINFGNNRIASKRFMAPLECTQYTEPLRAFIFYMSKIHPGIQNDNIHGLFLKSLKGCNQQSFHYDDTSYNGNNIHHDKCSKLFINQSLTVIAALEDNDNPTRLVVGTSDDHSEVHIPQGSIIVIRGNTFHAGASYARDNTRLFFGLGTKIYGNKGEDVLTEL